MSKASSSSKKALAQQNTFRGVWSQDEHDLFLEALQLHPQGPWKVVAEHIGTRSVRQVQTHAQKYHEKVARRLLGLRKERKKMVRSEHRIDDEMMNLCRDIEHNGRLSTVSSISSASSTSSSFATTMSHTSCESCGARPSGSFGSLSASTPSGHHHHNHSHSVSRRPFEAEYDEIISFGDDDAIDEEDDEDGFGLGMHGSGDDAQMMTMACEQLQPTTFNVQAEAAARQAAAAHQHGGHAGEEKRELPSFSDCLDFLIDAFSSSSTHERRRHRHDQQQGTSTKKHRWGR
ncbi:Myb-like dna-binding protein [Globisporangium polare]